MVEFNEYVLNILEDTKKELNEIENVLIEESNEIDKEWLDKMNTDISSVSDDSFYAGAQTIGDVVRLAKQERKQVLEKLSNCLENESEKQAKLSARLLALNKLISAQEKAQEEKESEKYDNAQIKKSAIITSMLNQIIDKIDEEIKKSKEEIIECSSKIAESIGKEEIIKLSEALKNNNKKIIELIDLKEALIVLKSYNGSVYSGEFIQDLTKNLASGYDDLVKACYELITENSIDMKKGQSKEEEDEYINLDEETKNKIEEIKRLLDKAEKELDMDTLRIASEMIIDLPECKEKDELSKRADEIYQKILEKQIEGLLDEAEKTLDIKILNNARELISRLTDEEKRRHYEKRADEIEKLIKEKKQMDGEDIEDKIEEIKRLLDKAEKELDMDTLRIASEMIIDLPECKEKDELSKRADEIYQKILEKQIEELLDEAEKTLDIKILNNARKLISRLTDEEKRKYYEKRADEIEKLIRKVDNDDLDNPKPEQPTIVENSPKKTWKTYVSLAAGIGIGAAVFFTCGGVGVSVMAIAGGIAKRLLAKRRRKLQMQRLKGEMPVDDVEEPLPGIEGKIQQLKKYFKSEEFCRDANWFLNGAIYTGLGLNIANAIYNFAATKLGASASMIQPDPEPEPTELDQTELDQTNPDPETTELDPAELDQTELDQTELDQTELDQTELDQTNPDPETTELDPAELDPAELDQTNPAEDMVTDPNAGVSDIKIGENVGDYNVSVGHDTASQAVAGTNVEKLLSAYVNENSIFKRFAIINSDGSVGEIINTKGLSVTDFCNEAGIDPSQVAVDIANKKGASQAWVSVDELLKGVGGKKL